MNLQIIELLMYSHLHIVIIKIQSLIIYQSYNIQLKIYIVLKQT